MYYAIEYPMAGTTYTHDRYGVYRYDEYPEWSALAGRTRRSYVADFETLDEARDAFPYADWDGEGITGYDPSPVQKSAPAWFDPTLAGESWDGE